MASTIRIAAGEYPEISKNTLLYLEGSSVFSYKVEWYDSEQGKFYSREHNLSLKQACFGDLTKHISHKYEMTGSVTIYFNNYVNEPVKDFVNVTKNITSNIGTFLPFSVFKTILSKMQNCLQQYVPHSVHTALVKKPVANYSTLTGIMMNRHLHISFKEIYYYELFFLLNMYRRLITLNNVRSNLAAYELSNKRWHNLSFVQILLLTDLDNSIETPWDSLIGLCYLIGADKLTQFINVSNFKSLRNHPERFQSFYMDTYQTLVTNDFSVSRSGEHLNFDSLIRYKIKPTHQYKSMNDLMITDALPEDIEHLETYYRFLKHIISQNKKRLNK